MIEHIRKEDVVVLLDPVRRVLKPGGRFVLTIQLLLDLVSFTSKSQKKFGTNISVAWLVRESPRARSAARALRLPRPRRRRDPGPKGQVLRWAELADHGPDAGAGEEALRAPGLA